MFNYDKKNYKKMGSFKAMLTRSLTLTCVSKIVYSLNRIDIDIKRHERLSPYGPLSRPYPTIDKGNGEMIE